VVLPRGWLWKLFKRKYNFLRESPPVLSMSLWIIKLNV
jgi:hypothetical protein